MNQKIIALLSAAALCAGMTACGSSASTSSGTPVSSGSDTSASAPASAPITVISREDGSGTRGAFIELFGVEQKDADGNKVDHTTELAEITNSTSVMMTTVAGNINAIGYCSLGSLNDSGKALTISGV
ncbi:MAG: phosphate ABC transporter substrate-binding protein, partial [Butyricicoccus sp.]